MRDKQTPDSEQLWQQALGELRLQMPKATFDTWLANTRALAFEDSTLTVGVANSDARDWLENRLLTTMKRILVGVVGHPVEVYFKTVSPDTLAFKDTAPAEQIEVRPVYLSAHSAIVQPDRLAAATAYFRDRWLPLLGALRWSLVVVLRGLATDAPLNPDGTRQVKTDRAELATRLGVTPRTISRLLKSHPLGGQRPWRVISPENEQAEYLSMFILRLRYRAVREGHVTRRTGLLFDVLMEDPLTPSDQQMVSLTTPLLGDAKGQNSLLHSKGAKGQNVLSLAAKGQNISLQPEGAKGQAILSQSAKGQDVRGNVNVNELVEYLKHKLELQLINKRQIRREIKPVVAMAEELLDDYHSTAMLYKVLLALYPDHLRLFAEAVEEAVVTGQDDVGANLGAVFVTTLKELAAEVGVELGLGGA